MTRFFTVLAKLVQYNIKIIFGNKFLYFILAALGFFVVFVIFNLLRDDEITQATAYSILAFPCVLLVFYPMCFGLQNDQDAKIVEILFGIPNYSYKVWLFRLLIAYIICFLITYPLALLTWAVVVEVPPARLTFHCLALALFLGTLSFMFSTYIKNGAGTAVVIIIVSIILFMFQSSVSGTRWDFFVNPFNIPLNSNQQVFYETLFNNRLLMGIASIVFILVGLNNTRNREKFI
ncbi:MAG: hypothetical protein LBP56_06785 [Odoribacteraceae bacterium]|jgi:hypothetical protein|nr:hypothetical protein [Odoribacteraceae bacterium]